MWRRGVSGDSAAIARACPWLPDACVEMLAMTETYEMLAAVCADSTGGLSSARSCVCGTGGPRCMLRGAAAQRTAAQWDASMVVESLGLVPITGFEGDTSRPRLCSRCV